MHRPTGSRCSHSRADRGDEELVQRVSIPFLFTTEHTEHTEINPPAVKLSFRVFGVFRGIALPQRSGCLVVDLPQRSGCLVVDLPQRSGCLDLARRATLSAGVRSHLSPDGGGFTRAAVHRLAADGYGKRPKGKRVTPSSAS